jgi:hypothetical protein
MNHFRLRHLRNYYYHNYNLAFFGSRCPLVQRISSPALTRKPPLIQGATGQEHLITCTVWDGGCALAMSLQDSTVHAIPSRSETLHGAKCGAASAGIVACGPCYKERHLDDDQAPCGHQLQSGDYAHRQAQGIIS